MGKEIQSIIIEEIEQEHDVYKKLELITLALANQIEHSNRLESIIEKQADVLKGSGEFTTQALRFMEISKNKFLEIGKTFDDIYKNANNHPGNELIILRKNISLLQENMKEIYELIINMK